MAGWAHLLWQRHHIRMEEFYNMNPRLRCLYIASELVVADDRRKQQDLARAKAQTK